MGLSDIGSTGDSGWTGPGVVGRMGTMEAGGASSRNGVTSRGFLSLANRLGAILEMVLISQSAEDVAG